MSRASVTKQYNLTLSKGRLCSVVGKVTVGLAEINGSLPPGLWLSQLLVDCLETGSAPVLTLVEFGIFTFALFQALNAGKALWFWNPGLHLKTKKTVVVLIFVLVSNLRFSGFVSDLIKLVL